MKKATRPVKKTTKKAAKPKKMVKKRAARPDSSDTGPRRAAK